MNYRSDTQQTKLPARRSQCARCHMLARPVICPCDAHAQAQVHAHPHGNAYRERGGADDLISASLQPWYPSDHHDSEDANGWT